MDVQADQDLHWPQRQIQKHWQTQEKETTDGHIKGSKSHLTSNPSVISGL